MVSGKQKERSYTEHLYIWVQRTPDLVALGAAFGGPGTHADISHVVCLNMVAWSTSPFYSLSHPDAAPRCDLLSVS